MKYRLLPALRLSHTNIYTNLKSLHSLHVSVWISRSRRKPASVHLRWRELKSLKQRILSYQLYCSIQFNRNLLCRTINCWSSTERNCDWQARASSWPVIVLVVCHKSLPNTPVRCHNVTKLTAQKPLLCHFVVWLGIYPLLHKVTSNSDF